MLRNLFFYFQVTFSSSLPSPLLKRGEQSEMSFRRYHHNSLGDLLHFFSYYYYFISIYVFSFLFLFVFVLFRFFLWGEGGAFFFSFFICFCFAIVVYFRLLNEENESNENMYYKKRN